MYERIKSGYDSRICLHTQNDITIWYMKKIINEIKKLWKMAIYYKSYSCFFFFNLKAFQLYLSKSRHSFYIIKSWRGKTNWFVCVCFFILNWSTIDRELLRDTKGFFTCQPPLPLNVPYPANNRQTIHYLNKETGGGDPSTPSININ